MPPLLIDSKFVPDISEKTNFLKHFYFIDMYISTKYTYFITFLYKTNAIITSFYVTKEEMI